MTNSVAGTVKNSKITFSWTDSIFDPRDFKKPAKLVLVRKPKAMHYAKSLFDAVLYCLKIFISNSI